MSSSGRQPVAHGSPALRFKAKSKKRDEFCAYIAAIGIGVVCLVLGSVCVSVIATEQRIIGYKENPIGLFHENIPEYQTYRYHPFWEAGVIILGLGIILLIAGVVALVLDAYSHEKSLNYQFSQPHEQPQPYQQQPYYRAQQQPRPPQQPPSGS